MIDRLLPGPNAAITSAVPASEMPISRVFKAEEIRAAELVEILHDLLCESDGALPNGSAPSPAQPHLLSQAS